MDNLIKISKMAQLNGISRQTLIYYDNIGLFKAAMVDDKGYRYYDICQIPLLREIRFLQAVGVKLEKIKEYFGDRSPAKEIEILEEQRVNNLQKIKFHYNCNEYMSQRMELIKESEEAVRAEIKGPFVKVCPQRRVLFKEYIKPIKRENLHLTLMTLWLKVFDKELVPCSGFGSIFRKEDLLAGEPLAHAGSCIFLPSWNQEYAESILIPERECACLFKYGMPYDTDSLGILLKWIDDNGYELCGDVLDICLLDTTFYSEQNNLDHCLLQAPIRPKKE